MFARRGMTYRLYIFDFDGTLADSAAWFRRELPRLAKTHRFPAPTPEELDGLRGQSSREIVRRLRIPPWKLPGIARDLRRRAARAAQFIAPFPGVADMLSRIYRSGARIAVVSSNSEWTVKEVLGAGPGACVSYYACGASMFGKAAKFKQVLRRAGVSPSDAISIGDEERDISAARRVGMTAAGVTWGYAALEALTAAEPSHIFETPGDIAALAAPRPLSLPRRSSAATS